MTIKKYKVLVTVEKEMEIEVNTDVINGDWMAAFSDGMWQVDELQEVVEHVAKQASVRDGYFIEGVGEWPKDYEREKNLVTQGVNIKYNDWDDSLDFDIQELSE